jgi:hypothetical protein
VGDRELGNVDPVDGVARWMILDGDRRVEGVRSRRLFGFGVEWMAIAKSLGYESGGANPTISYSPPSA